MRAKLLKRAKVNAILLAGTRAFHRLPAVYIFSTLGLVAPGFGLGGFALVLQPYQPSPEPKPKPEP